MSTVDHPAHYGGADNPYEAIKVIEAWDLNFRIGNAVKYLSRAGKKGDNLTEDLRKAIWYIRREIQKVTGVEERSRDLEIGDMRDDLSHVLHQLDVIAPEDVIAEFLIARRWVRKVD